MTQKYLIKHDLARAVVKHNAVPYAHAKEIIDTVFRTIEEGLLVEGRVELRGFGIFKVTRGTGVKRSGFTGRTTPVKRRVKFQPSVLLKRAVAGE